MLGCDVEYYNDLEDDKLIELAAKSGRTLLTRDQELFRKASTHGVEAFMITGATETEKLAEIAERFHINLELNSDNSRCPRCNAKLNSVSKEEVLDRIPQSTSRFYNRFWVCPNCGKVYWQGSHWRKITRKLSEAKKLAELSSSSR